MAGVWRAEIRFILMSLARLTVFAERVAWLVFIRVELRVGMTLTRVGIVFRMGCALYSMERRLRALWRIVLWRRMVDGTSTVDDW